MHLDLRDRCARPACHRLIRQGKKAQAQYRLYHPYCSYHCLKWHGIEDARAYLRTLKEGEQRQ